MDQQKIGAGRSSWPSTDNHNDAAEESCRGDPGDLAPQRKLTLGERKDS